MGGRITVESVVRCSWNGWPDDRGIRTVAEKAVFQELPYLETRVGKSGFGYEDWHWNLEVIASGRKHTLASGTCLFYRRKEASMLAAMGALNAVVRPGRFFDGRCFDH
ncbi:hypothetical protein N0387_21605, partial [Pseudomonas aeruginosa]|nr:hypothetical protein [Pseudomonas aeruginosa]MCS7851043.1 hypothetical protein [Pseudomonas aeruginosa]